MSLVLLQEGGGSGPPDSPLDPPMGFAGSNIFVV